MNAKRREKAFIVETLWITKRIYSGYLLIYIVLKLIILVNMTLINQNKIKAREDLLVLFIDMNSFFASCEQQDNFWLRGRPVGVCVYTGKHGCVIAPSIEAKKKGVKTGMRLDEAISLCPDLVPLETKPERYRNYHKKIMEVLRRHAQDVIPKSIDEAVINLRGYKLIYPDPAVLARKIKLEIKQEIGDWLRCSIGIAPNAFLAKLASNLKKPDGLETINPENIDKVLSGLSLRDLPGIGQGMEERLNRAGITSPLQLRYTPSDKLRRACKSILGEYWHKRLNFAEVDLMTHSYSSMQAMRQLSREQRISKEHRESLLIALCMKLERRMLQQKVYCQELACYTKYGAGGNWKAKVRLTQPLQDGNALLKIIQDKMKQYEQIHVGDKLLNPDLRALCVYVSDFIPEDQLQYHLFEDEVKNGKLRRLQFDINQRYGSHTLIRATELSHGRVLRDAIGFGSVKDLTALDDKSSEVVSW